MTNQWKTRLKEAIDADPKLSMKGVSVAAGLSDTAVRDILVRDRNPQINNFLAIAKAANVDPSWLLKGKESETPEIRIIGQTMNSEECILMEDEPDKGSKAGGARDMSKWWGRIKFKLNTRDPIALLVGSNELAPAYCKGDIIIAARVYGGDIENVIGSECIVAVEGKTSIKYVQRYGHSDKYTLRSRFTYEPDIEDIKLDWAAPIVWVKRTR